MEEKESGREDDDDENLSERQEMGDTMRTIWDDSEADSASLPQSAPKSTYSSSEMKDSAGKETEAFEIDLSSRKETQTVEEVSELVDKLYMSYPKGVSVGVVSAIVVYTGLLCGCMFGKAYSMWSNIPALVFEKLGNTSEVNSTSLQEIGAFNMYSIIGVTFTSDAYATSILVSLFSFFLPVWFAPLTLKSRSRLLRWMSRLASLVLFFFYTIILVTALLQVAYTDTSGELRILRGQPEAAVYIFLVLAILLLILVEWIFVLHYNSTYWTGRLHGSEGIDEDKKNKWYFGANNTCQVMCCVRDLVDRRPLDKDKIVSCAPKAKAKFQGWQYAEGSEEKSKANLRLGSASITTMATDMEFVRGSYKYVCSCFGFIALVSWFVVFTMLGFVTFFAPLLEMEFTVDDELVLDKTETIASIGVLVASPVSTYESSGVGGLIVLVVFYYLLIASFVIILHVLMGAAIFLPIESLFGKRVLRAICHIANILITFTSLEVFILSILVLASDYSALTQGLIGGEFSYQNTSSSWLGYQQVCYNPPASENVCIGVEFGSALPTGLATIVFGIPFVYYFAETYHRHFGIVVDGRNQQTTSSGETTHKHRAEGCIVLACYGCFCCSRKEYTFRQESVDEDIYYDGEAHSLFVPEGLFTSDANNSRSGGSGGWASAAPSPRPIEATNLKYRQASVIFLPKVHEEKDGAKALRKADSLPRDFRPLHTTEGSQHHGLIGSQPSSGAAGHSASSSTASSAASEPVLVESRKPSNEAKPSTGRRESETDTPTASPPDHPTPADLAVI